MHSHVDLRVAPLIFCATLNRNKLEIVDSWIKFSAMVLLIKFELTYKYISFIFKFTQYKNANTADFEENGKTRSEIHYLQQSENRSECCSFSE